MFYSLSSSSPSMFILFIFSLSKCIRDECVCVCLEIYKLVLSMAGFRIGYVDLDCYLVWQLLFHRAPAHDNYACLRIYKSRWCLLVMFAAAVAAAVCCCCRHRVLVRWAYGCVRACATVSVVPPAFLKTQDM